MQQPELNEADVSAVIEMALSDHVSFADIEREYGLSDSQTKQLMRSSLKPSSYRNWRKRVREFSDRREHYKERNRASASC
ncbi:TIGR03643 family protein [Pontixanthobacter aestiaquae]|uniref:TIGR03643 family protein n=1 Tax=Pontixanthobacter aestiaquae TaxID=1509367 RepID=UPI0025B444CD|nr:TIGR03643 family protein [Pontixanthobacter aestiaquae]MDN3645765.1 TIGR03643 family protein [Pontixanthobacter aestiaquae]